MELQSVHKTFHHSHLGDEKHQMLNLNGRLETYLGRVKLLEEENALLAKEIHALRRSNHGASTRREGLEEELWRARLEADTAWRDRVHMELEACKVAEELQALELQRQREAQAQVEAKKKLEQSRKELEEEQRAQIWLRERVGQLENEMRHLIRTHQEDVAHLEATLTRSRAKMVPTFSQRSNQTPNLLQLGQEYSEWATRAWQEAAEAQRGQLERLEESLNQARSRLTQVDREKSESQLKLRALEKEIQSAHDVRMHLEKTADQQGDRYSQEIQHLQEHLDGLEAEKEELGQQIGHLVLENRGLLQQKASLGLEVSTYRALLDGESLRGDIPLINQPRNVSITDAVFSPWGVKKNYQTQLSAGHKTTSLSSVRGLAGRGPTAVTTTPIWSRKPVTLSNTAKISSKPDATKSATWETPYPKILQDGAVENFRPQEVHERVTYAEPLSPPNEQEAETTSGDKEGEEDWNNVGVKPPEEDPALQSAVSYQVESGLSTEPPFNKEVSQHQFMTPNLTPYHVRMKEEPCGFSDESDTDAPLEKPVGKEDMQELHAPIDAWTEKEFVGKEIEHVQEETSDSETEAVIEPNFDSRTNSPESECEPNEFSRGENISKEDAAEMRDEISCSILGRNETDVEDKLYPDGEEMDTWDSVIERKVDLKTDEGMKKDEEKGQHAEPEEDISAREQKHEQREIRSDFAKDIQQDNNEASSMMDTQVDDDGHNAALDQEHALFPDNEEDDEEEDSQNVSVSWRTELESDSYAQENTLADTRPLIRYKSDDTDGNVQASHMDESDSSEGEQDKKIGETGMWSEGKSKRFGTMEDLCEEVEGEAPDEEYNLGYTHIVGHGMTVSEGAKLVNAEEMIRKVSEGHSDVETEELTKPTTPRNVCYDEELETDRLVEQELENLATDSYSAQFARQQVSASEEMLHWQGNSVEQKTEQEATSCTEPDVRVNQQLASSTRITDQHYENRNFGDSSVVMPQADTVAYEDVQRKDQEAIDAPEKREDEDEHNASMVTHADVTEDHSSFNDFISRPDMEETDNSEDPNSVLQVIADQQNLQDVAALTEVKEVAPGQASGVPEEQHVADRKEFPEAPETAEWEVLENPGEDFEIGDQGEDYQKCDKVPESAKSYLHDDGGSYEGVITRKVETLEISPGSVPDENNIFVVKDSAELMNTNGKDNSLHSLFSSGLTNDFWVSSMEAGATYQPDDACNEASEQTNQNLGFAENLVWGNSENVVNWNSRVDIDSSKALKAKKEPEQMHSEVKQVLCRNVVEGELVRSDESDVEGESWSSGEEPV
ncbi:nestin [Anoplopoma fimbria]|uniref:nestin n=1 Tax=Anoplopoma fimbria TaxID=229290 RepID=UPI0023ED7374|nr:nestin [Anoplopoma fimbria]